MPLKSNFCDLVSISMVSKTLIQLALWYPIYKKTQINASDFPCTLAQHFLPVTTKAAGMSSADWQSQSSTAFAAVLILFSGVQNCKPEARLLL